MSDIGRVTRCVVSAHNRDRVHYGQVYSPERRQLVTDFNGALPPGVTISKATWNTLDNWTGVMSDPVVDGRKVSINVQAQIDGACCIRLDAELSNGERYCQWHVLRILPARYVRNDNWITGPQQLVAFPPETPLP